MSFDNPSVEELLKSLRQAVETRSNSESKPLTGDNVIELKNPITKPEVKVQKKSEVNSNVLGFLNEIVEQAVSKVLTENEDLLKDSLENVLLQSDDVRSVITHACESYFAENIDFDAIVRNEIEKKVESIIRSYS